MVRHDGCRALHDGHPAGSVLAGHEDEAVDKTVNGRARFRSVQTCPLDGRVTGGYRRPSGHSFPLSRDRITLECGLTALRLDSRVEPGTMKKFRLSRHPWPIPVHWGSHSASRW